jgi:hypothetical protein
MYCYASRPQILCDSKCVCTGLWMFPLHPSNPTMTPPTTAFPLTAVGANVAATSTSTASNHAHFIPRCYAHHQFQHSSGPSHKYLNSQLSWASLPTSSFNTYHHQQPLIRATCNGTAKVSKLRGRNNQLSFKHAPTLIPSSPPKTYALPMT